MAFSVILDTCVLYPAHLRDTLLRLAERNLYQARWSSDVIEELRRNLVKADVASGSVDGLIKEMLAAFPEAEVKDYQVFIETVTCHPKDRHVLAAAVRGEVGAIVTHNVGDFPPSSVDPHQIEVVHPDDFLLDLLELAPGVVVAELHAQAAANRRAPKTLPDLLGALAIAGAPSFADEIRRRLT